METSTLIERYNAYEIALDAEPEIATDNITYSPDAYESAASKFLDEPSTLTDRDIAQLARVSQSLGKEAAVLRRGLERPEPEGTHHVPLPEFLRYVRTETIFRARDRFRIRELEQRIAELEARQSKGFNYRGVWQAGEVYSRNDVITMNGSMWICTAQTTVVEPKFGDETASASWSLCVKAGRPGRDAR